MYIYHAHCIAIITHRENRDPRRGGRLGLGVSGLQDRHLGGSQPCGELQQHRRPGAAQGAIGMAGSGKSNGIKHNCMYAHTDR